MRFCRVSPYTFAVGVAGQAEKFYVKLHGTKELLSQMFKIDPIVLTDVPLRPLPLNAVMETSVIAIALADLSGTMLRDNHSMRAIARHLNVGVATIHRIKKTMPPI